MVTTREWDFESRGTPHIPAVWVLAAPPAALDGRILGTKRPPLRLWRADPETLLFTSTFADEPLRAAGARFLVNEFGSVDVNQFRRLARARHPVATLDEATRGDRKSSPRFREIIAPLGFGDDLRVALRTRGTTWALSGPPAEADGPHDRRVPRVAPPR
jgi:hypothetical protein